MSTKLQMYPLVTTEQQNSKQIHSNQNQIMEQIKYVIDELNQPPFNQNLNLISYDNLRNEQRLDILVQILNTIDPKLNLVSVRVGNIEEIVTTILDTLRIFKYTPPTNHINPTEFRKNLILADKDLLTNIFEWLLKRLPALKKRAYLARFLVKIELTPEVEGDQEVINIYKQYLRLIDEFKKTHSSYENQKKSIDSIIELQKDIKTMEIEKEQIKNKLDIAKRRVNIDQTELSNSGKPTDQGNAALFEKVVSYVMAKKDNEKLQQQIVEQNNRIETIKQECDIQQSQLNELRLNADSLLNSDQTPDMIMDRIKEDASIKQRLVKDVLPTELTEMRSLVRDIEGVYNQPESVIKEYLSKVNRQIRIDSEEIQIQMEKKLMEKDSEEDRLLHFKQNAQNVSHKKEQVLQKYLQLEKAVNVQQEKVQQLRSQFSDGDLPLHGEALKLYIEKISKKEAESEQKRAELKQLKQEVQQLTNKVNGLRQQETDTMKDIRTIEEMIGIEGYLMMKENSLNVLVDDDGDGVEDVELLKMSDVNINTMNVFISNYQQQLEQMKASHTSAMRQGKQMKELLQELENEFDMKKRLYDSAAAGLETKLKKSEIEWKTLKDDLDKLDLEQYRLHTELIVQQVQRDQYLSSVGVRLLELLRQQVEDQSRKQQELKQKEKDVSVKEDFYKKQIEMWRDLKAIFDVKSKILAIKQEEKTRNEFIINSNVNHLVLN